MIANLDIKLCPFRKETSITDYKYAGNGFPIAYGYSENFLECLEEKCIGWDKKEHSCLLMRKEDK